MKPLRLVLAVLVLSLLTTGALADVTAPQRTQGIKAPVPEGTHTLVSLRGPGKFISAQITKQGGRSDVTFIVLDIDVKNVVNVSVAALRNWGLKQNNTYGLVILEGRGDIKTVTIGFPTPLVFRSNLKLSVTVKEAGVKQILANVIHGR